MPYDTFISYSHHDHQRAIRVHDHLVGSGLRVWMDRDYLKLGNIFRRSIGDALDETKTLTPILTDNALESAEVYKEVKLGIDKGKKIIPVVLSPQTLYNSKKWRGLLGELNWGSVNLAAQTRNITDEVLADIIKAIRQPDDRKCPVISIYHFKGGVGKTTIAAHLAAQLYESANQPISVLLIDCDAQSNLSSVFLTRQKLAQVTQQSHNLIGMLEPNRLLAEHDLFQPYDIAPGAVSDRTIHQVQTVLQLDKSGEKPFSIIPNSIAATKYSTVNPSEHSQIFINFQNAIQKLSLNYDVIIIDCNPSTTLLSQCALGAATDVLIPLRADKYTSDGLENIDELFGKFFKLDFVRGVGLDRKQVWTLVNYADLTHIRESNEERSRGKGAEADLLNDILRPLQSGMSIGQFAPSLLDARIPESGFLRSKAIETERLSPDQPSSRSLLKFFSNLRAKPTADAFVKLAEEMRYKTRGAVKVVSV